MAVVLEVVLFLLRVLLVIVVLLLEQQVMVVLKHRVRLIIEAVAVAVELVDQTLRVVVVEVLV